MLDQELSNVFWCFGVLSVREVSLLDALAEEMTHPRILTAFIAQALSNVVLACARLDYVSNPRFLQAFADEIARPYRLKSFEEQHLGNILWAVGKLGCAEPSQLKALAQECIAPHRVGKFTPNQLCNVFTGWAHLGDSFCEEAYHVLLHRILHPTDGLIPKFSPSLMAKLIWSMGKLRSTTQSDFEIAVRAASREELFKKYNNHDLSNIFIGCGKQRLNNRQLILPLIQEAVTAERLMTYNALQLANLTWALGEMGIRDKRSLRLLARGVVESGSLTQQPSLVVMVLRGWAHVDFRYTPGLLKITEAMLKPSTLAQFTPRDIRAVLWCLRALHFKESYIIQLLEDQLPENNKGVMARFRQRSMAQDDRQWPEFFTVRSPPS